MSPPKHTPSHHSSPRDLQHRVTVCLTKLSDRDTHSAAAKELESIAKTLTHESIPPFLSSISATDSSDKSPVRKQCVRLISTLSESHGDVLSPYTSKLLSAVIRRLRDPDTAVRTACVAATASIASHVTKPPFVTVAKPFVDALVTAQDLHAQIGAALCLATVIESAPDPDAAYLRRLFPRVEKLLRSGGFRAKAALLAVVASVIGVGAASSAGIVRSLVKMMSEFVAKSEEWAVRKAAAEVLERLAVVETDLLPEYKASCLKMFEAKKFDKVKGVRETMNQMIEAWNAVQDVAVEEVSPPPESRSSSSKGSSKEEDHTQNPPEIMSKQTATRRSSFEYTSRKTGPAMFRKLDRTNPNDQKPDTTDGQHMKPRSLKQETKRALFSEISEEKTREPQYHDYVSSSSVAVHQDSEDLSLIRNQLVQIENQQSSLFDLLEKYIGSSEDGMRSLESRVRGLELTLDEISFDLAKSTGQGSNPEPTMCWKLPGADLLSSKLWKKSEIQPSNARYASSSVKKKSLESYNVQTTGFHPDGGGSGLIKNPLTLAEIDLDHEIAQQTKLRSAPHERLKRGLARKEDLLVSPVKMLAAREGNYSGRGRFSSADRCHILNKYLPVKGPSVVDQLTTRAYVSQFSNDGSLFVAAFKKIILAKSLRWTVTDTSLSPDERFLVYATMSPTVNIVNIGSAATESHANVTV
ncbi:hypothetical protein SSX86_008831 [Deinandra increscens subsp. villosa]|uniref:TORTIFOLIA1/SINE1-2 N-terminal domain-containing protein n=1 Tax=Deinandra increscens subsp. villosa TaxID=3103831 RepID=A0AAP0DGM8_9ASTR